MPEAYVIRRGWFSSKHQYWSSFRGDGQRRRPRLEWSKSIDAAIRFARESDASQFIVGMRLYGRRKPRAIKAKFDEVRSRS